MELFYPEIRSVHIASVIASGGLLLLRGLALNLFGARRAMALPLRFLSWTVDTVMLTTALMLTTIIQQFPFADSWLTVKVLLLAPYVLLGYFALRARTPVLRWFSLFGAAAVFYFIYTVARAHHPLGLFV